MYWLGWACRTLGIYPDAQASQAGVVKPQLLQQDGLVEPYGLCRRWMLAKYDTYTGVTLGHLNPQAGDCLRQMPDETALYQ